MEGGSREIVKFLIEQGYGTPDQTQDGRAFTPLHLASRAGHAELVSLLLNVGYQADRPDKDGRTPLHCAALGGHIGFLEANQSLMNPPGSMRPCLDHRFTTKELLGQGVDPTALDDNMCTALHYACGECFASIPSLENQDYLSAALYQPSQDASFTLLQQDLMLHCLCG